MTADRRLHAMDLGRRDHTRWLGVHRVSSRLTLPTANLIAAYDARAGVTDDGSGLCSAWADQSGNGFNATQGTAILRPAITTTDGYASILFDGTNDSLTTSMTASSGTKSIYYVIRHVSLGGVYRAVWYSQTPLIFTGVLPSNNIGAYDTGNRDSLLTAPLTLCRVTHELRSGSSQAWRNGVAGTSTSWSGSNLAIGGTVNIGAAPSGLANNLSAHLLFLAVYGADRNTDVEAYITQEWGV